MTNTEWVEQVTWTPLEPKAQQPFKLSPIERYGHAAHFSKVCSLGYTIEEGVLAGRIVLETLLVRRAHTSCFSKVPYLSFPWPHAARSRATGMLVCGQPAGCTKKHSALRAGSRRSRRFSLQRITYLGRLHH